MNERKIKKVAIPPVTEEPTFFLPLGAWPNAYQEPLIKKPIRGKMGINANINHSLNN
jgi:hypothetical protein